MSVGRLSAFVARGDMVMDYQWDDMSEVRKKQVFSGLCAVAASGACTLRVRGKVLFADRVFAERVFATMRKLVLSGASSDAYEVMWGAFRRPECVIEAIEVDRWHPGVHFAALVQANPRLKNIVIANQ
jgi:hypothetical protein